MPTALSLRKLERKVMNASKSTKSAGLVPEGCRNKVPETGDAFKKKNFLRHSVGG